MAQNIKPLQGNGSWISYAIAKRERSNHTFSIDCNGEAYYTVHGCPVPESEFNQMFPLEVIRESKGTRLDGKQRIY